jgi:hypothetical protein
MSRKYCSKPGGRDHPCVRLRSVLEGVRRVGRNDQAFADAELSAARLRGDFQLAFEYVKMFGTVFVNVERRTEYGGRGQGASE